jgi:hypothetical protein
MLRSLPLLLLALTPSCMVVISDVDVRRADGAEDSYLVKRSGDRLSRVEVDWGRGEDILAARIIVFSDQNEDRRPDEGEILHDVLADLDGPVSQVVWRNLRLDETELDGPFLVRFELTGEKRGEYVRTSKVLPEDLFDW